MWHAGVAAGKKWRGCLSDIELTLLWQFELELQNMSSQILQPRGIFFYNFHQTAKHKGNFAALMTSCSMENFQLGIPNFVTSMHASKNVKCVLIRKKWKWRNDKTCMRALQKYDKNFQNFGVLTVQILQA